MFHLFYNIFLDIFIISKHTKTYINFRTKQDFSSGGNCSFFFEIILQDTEVISTSLFFKQTTICLFYCITIVYEKIMREICHFIDFEMTLNEGTHVQRKSLRANNYRQKWEVSFESSCPWHRSINVKWNQCQMNNVTVLP